MTFCPNCGNDLGDTQGSFCSACGKPIEELKTQDNVEHQPEPETRRDDELLKPQVQYVEKKTNGLAIAGFVVSFFAALVGLILSWIALSQIKDNPNQDGKGLAIAGVIISAATIVITILIVVLLIVFAENTADSPYFYYSYGEFFS